MSTEGHPARASGSPWRVLTHQNVLSGLMFIGIAVFGLIVSWNYPIGTALRMGTGYVPRLLCWILLGLGCLVLLQGLREARVADGLHDEGGWGWRPLLFVTASLVIFGLAIEGLGLVVSILLLTAVGALAHRGMRPIETALAAVVLIVLSWAIFIVGLGLTIPVWPEW